jgi:hypothetical protein
MTSIYPHFRENEIADLNPDGTSKYRLNPVKAEEQWKDNPLSKKYESAWNFIKEANILGINVEDPFANVDLKLKLLKKYTSLENLYIGSEKDSEGKTVKIIRKSLESCAQDSNSQNSGSSRLGEVFKSKFNLANDILNGKRLNNKF